MTGKPTNIRWRIFLVLALASFVSYVLRANISIAAPTMIEELGLTEIQWGWILAAFTMGYSIFQIPGGVFGDKAGPRKALTIIAVLWGIFMILTIAIPGPDVASAGVVIGSLIAVRFLVGAVHAPIYPVMNTAISRWFPVGGWALPLGLSSTALTLGFAATAPVLAWLILDFGWRVAFLLLAPLGFIVAGIWWWYVRYFPSDHAAINEAEVALIAAKRPAPVEIPAHPPGWVRILKNRNMLLLTLSYTCSNFVFGEVFGWFYYYLVEVREFDPTDAGWVTASQWAAGGAGAALGGWLCDRLCKKLGLRWGCRWPIIIALVGCSVLLVAGAYHTNPIVAVTLLALCFFFHQLTEGAYWAASIAIGTQLAGMAGGILNTGANAMSVVSALLVPWFAHQFGWQFAIASGAIFALIAVVLLLFVRADETIKLD